MLKKKAMKKIFTTTLTMFIILTIFTIPNSTKRPKVLRTNLEIEDITNLNTDSIYLLNKDNYLVKTEVFIDSSKLEQKIEKIIEYLTINNNKIPIGLNGYIPKDTKLIDFLINDKDLTLNFTKELLSSDQEELVITGIVYSLLEQEKIKTVSIKVENTIMKEYQLLNKSIGINKEYLYSSKKNLKKIVLYYMDDTNSYYVPVTKYLNDDREKIEIIIDELKNTEDNLISLENIHTELLNYHEEANSFVLNFNDYLLDKNEAARDKLLNTIAYSVFDNYDVNIVLFECNNKKIKQIRRK